MSNLQSDALSDDEKPLTPEQQRLVSKARWLMAVSGAATFLGIAVVLGVIGYRVFKSEGSTQADVISLLPKGAKIVATTVAEDRIIVTLDVGGATEIRTFDARSLKPVGRLKFAVEP